jgi:uncharacterized protein (DUF885 family)
MPATVESLCHDVYELQITESPADAALVGAPDADRRFPDVVNTFQYPFPLDPERRERLAREYGRFVTKLASLDREGLVLGDLHTRSRMVRALKTRLDLLNNTDWMRPVDDTSTSTPQLFADDLAGKGRFPLRSKKDLDAALERAQGWGPWVTQAVINMREGVRTGHSQPQAILEAALTRQENLLRPGVLRTLIANSLKKVKGVSDEAGNRYIDDMTQFAGDGYFRLSEEIRRLLPEARPNSKPGLCHLPNGPAEYGTLLGYWRGYNVRKDDIEVLQEEMKASYEDTVGQLMSIARRLGHSSVSSLVHYMHSDPSMMPFKSKQEVSKHLADHRTLIVENGGRIIGMSREDLWYDIHVIETGPETANNSVIYTPGNEGREGAIYVYIGDPTKFRLPPTIFHSIHEGFGHLSQLTTQQQLPLPLFLRHFAPQHWFRESFALYMERFAEELGFEPDDYARAERLKRRMNCYRGMLLDVGIHHSYWDLRHAQEVRRSMHGNDGEAAEKDDILRFMAWAGRCLY